MIKHFQVRTNVRTELIDITSKVQKVVSETGAASGVCYVFVPHTTAAVTINENADSDVVRDIIKGLNKIVPHDDNYAHREGNSAAHIKSSMIGVSLSVLIENGELVLGTWQGIYFCEFDGPRDRDVMVKVMKG